MSSFKVSSAISQLIAIAVIALAVASLFTSNWLLLVAISLCMLMILARGVWMQRRVQGDTDEQ